MLTVMICGFFILLFIGVPVAFSMGFAGFAALIYGNIPLLVAPQKIFTSIDSFPMMAIPLFILAGSLMESGGITSRIVYFTSSLVGHIKGGLAHAAIIAGMILAGLSGSASADTSAIGAMIIPTMKKRGYDASFSVAVVASAGSIGPIIPPSILMIIYGSITGLSVGSLFLGGVVPGILMGISMMVVIAVYAHRHRLKGDKRATLKEVWKAFYESLVALIMPFIIIGGILTGIFTATEAGVVACIYGFLVGFFVLKELRLNSLKKIFLESTKTTASTMFVIACAQIMGWILGRENFPALLSQSMLSITNNPNLIMLMVLVILFIMGLFIDGTAALIILIPVLFPLGQLMGFDPIYFAIIILLMIMIGAITPPVGVLLFISCGIGKISLTEASKQIWPFVLGLWIVVMACVFIPQLITFLPRFFM